MTQKLSVAVVLAVLLVVQPDGQANGADKEPAKAPDDKAGWKSLFDGKTLAGWKEADLFGGTGKISVKDGAIVMDKGNDMSGIVYTRGDFPTLDYEVILEGKKLAGDDFFCTTTFPVGKSFCSFVVGGWGGQVTGLSSLNGADASENETTGSKEFKKDRWYRVRVRVTKERIRAWIDDEELVDATTRDRQISVRIECEPCKPFGVATWNTSGAVRDIRVRLLSEAEKKAEEKKAD